MAKQSLTMDDGTVVNYTPLISIKCMFCGRIATIVEFDDGNMGVTHVTPECSEFIAMDPLTFISENRRLMLEDLATGKYDPN